VDPGGVVDFCAPFIEVDGGSEDIESVDVFSVLVDVVSVLGFGQRSASIHRQRLTSPLRASTHKAEKALGGPMHRLRRSYDAVDDRGLPWCLTISYTLIVTGPE
jgi:hypothetical protein